MASRDRSQGFVFAYVDVAKLLKERDEVAKHIDQNSPVEESVRPVPAPVQTVNFNKDRITSETKAIAPAQVEAPRPSVQEIRQNLDRLQALHHKLHAMLEELDKVTDNPKKRNR